MYSDPYGLCPSCAAAAALMVTAAKYGPKIYKKAKDIYQDFDFEGPRKNRKGDTSQLCQVKYKKQPIFRVEQHAFSPVDRTPVLHWHRAPNMKEHRSFPWSSAKSKAIINHANRNVK